MKIVVFDLDETLGYFVEFGIFWSCLQNYLIEEKNNNSLTQEDFNEILDLYPEFLRPNIITLLKYLIHKKKSKCCNKILIYTNNQAPKEWCKRLITFFEDKLKFTLFDQIINAFKINGEIVEICRSTHDKTFNDLVKCTKIPSNSKICFLDDNYYPEMSNDHVYYINIKPYIHDLDFEEMIQRFWNSSFREKIFPQDEISDKKEGMKDNKKYFENKMVQNLKSYDYFIVPKTKEETNIDRIISKQILIHLQYFFDKYKKDMSPSYKTKNTKSVKKGKKQTNRTRKRDV